MVVQVGEEKLPKIDEDLPIAGISFSNIIKYIQHLLDLPKIHLF